MCGASLNEIPIPCEGNNPTKYKTRLCKDLNEKDDEEKNFVFTECFALPTEKKKGPISTVPKNSKKPKNRPKS